MKAICSDLDHTLIYSHRQKLPEPRIEAERLHGKPQSYMSERTFSMLRSLPVDLIPVTTRTPEQFLRISLFQGEIPYKTALLCCGAYALTDGQPDRPWNAASERLAGDALHTLRDIWLRMKQEYGTAHLHYAEPFLVYFVPDDPAAEAVRLREICPESLAVCRDHRKLYIYPAVLNKGTAVQRLRSRYGYDRILAAGDSITDVPMLNAADCIAAPSSLRPMIRPELPALYQSGEWLCDTVCDAAAAFLAEDA